MKKYKSWFVINVFCLLIVALVTGIYCINNPVLNNDGNMGHTIGKNVSISGVANHLNIGESQSTTFEKNMKIEEGDSETGYTFGFDPFSFISTSQDIEFSLDLANLDDTKDILVTISLEESLPAGVTVSLNSTYVTLPYECILAKSGEVSLKFGFSSNSITTIPNFKLNINFKHVSSLNNAYLAKNWKDVVYATFGADASNTTQIDFVNDLSAYKISDFVGFNTTTGLATSANIGALNYYDSDAMTESSSTVANINTYAIKTTENSQDTYKLVVYTPSKLYANRTLAECLKDYTKLRIVTFNNFDTTNCFNYHGMFANCTSLTDLDVSKFNVTLMADDLGYMFYNCSSLSSLDLSNFNTGLTQNMKGMFAYCSSLQSLNITSFDTTWVKDMAGMFYGCKNLQSIDVSRFSTSNVTNMTQMFQECNLLQAINVSSFNTEKVTNMNAMFAQCKTLKNIDLSSFKTPLVTDMAGMFNECINLEVVTIPQFDNNVLSDTNWMFGNCSSLLNLDLSQFNTSTVKNMRGMFINCNSLQNLNISNFDMSNVTSCASMLEFGTSNAIQTLRTPKNAPEELQITSANTLYWENEQAPVVFAGLSESRTYTYIAPSSTSFPTDWKTQLANTYGNMTINSVSTPVAYENITSISFNYYAPSGYTQIGRLDSGVKVYNNNSSLTDLLFVWGVNIKAPSTSNSLFNGLPNVVSIALNNFDTTSTTKMGWMFHNNSMLSSITFGESFVTTSTTLMEGMFQGTAIESVDLSKFNTSKVTSMNAMFAQCTNLKSVDLSSFNTSLVQDMAGMFNECTNLTSITIPQLSNDALKNIDWMFGNCSSLETLDLSQFNTSSVETMGSMFYGCTNIQILNINNFNTSKVNNMSWMFGYCQALKTLDLSNFNTSLVEDMSNMFINCTTLETVNVSGFNTEKVTNMNSMFYKCNALKTLNLSSFNTEKVTNMNAMFAQCSKLTSLDLNSFKTPLVEDMGGMFNDCSSLANLTFPKFVNMNLKNMKWMFGRCSSLETLDMSEFYTSNVTDMSYLFYLCTNLKTLDISNFDMTNVSSYDYIYDFSSSPEVIYTPRITKDAINILKNNTLYDLETGSTLTAMPGSLASSKTLVNTSPVTFASDWKSKIQSTSYMSTTINPSSITSIAFEKTAPSGYSYKGAFSGVSVYANGNQVAFVSSSAIKSPTTCTDLFKEMSNVQRISFNNFYTSVATAMDGMFKDNASLQTINFSLGFKVQNVKNMQFMFHGSSNILTLDLSRFHTWSLEGSLRAMFWNCASLTTLDVRNFKTSKVTDFWDTFSACSSLTYLDLSTWDTSSLTNTQYMFNECTALDYLDLSSFDMTKVTLYDNMLNFGSSNQISTLKTPKITKNQLSITTLSTTSSYLSYNGSTVTTIPANLTASRTYERVYAMN